jgi:uncharacterized membrane protein
MGMTGVLGWVLAMTMVERQTRQWVWCIVVIVLALALAFYLGYENQDMAKGFISGW